MADKPVIKDAVAIVPVRDVAETIRFYTDILGFEGQVLAEDDSYGSVQRGGAAMDLLATDDADALKATATNIALAVWVEGLDDLYAELKSKLDTLPKGRVRPPFDQPYGVREFHVKDPDGCLLFFAERD
jgi:catechol 2,3-dioxygenase-like lactoylglutathione lyase family enzyme